MRAALAAVHHKQPFGGKSTTLHQRSDARLEGLVLQRFELVEQRRDEAGVNQQQQQVKAHPQAPGPQPPQTAHHAPRSTHHPKYQGHNGQANQHANQRGFDQVHQPQFESHFVKAKALLQHKGLVQRDGQIDQAANHRKRRQQGELLPHPATTEPLHHGLIQHRQPAQQRPADQHCGAKRHFQQAKARFGNRVISRLLMRRQADPAGKCGGHGIAVPGDVADLARGEPEFDNQAGHQRGREGHSQRERRA